MATLRELSNLKGRRALITGAAGGLGQVFADTLAEVGADLILVDLPGTNLTSIADKLNKDWGVTVESIFCDLENQFQRSDLIRQVANYNKNLNILINNAAFVGTSDLIGWNVPFEEQSVDSWRRAVEVNITAVFDLCQGFIPLMENAEGANIVNIASIYGYLAPYWQIYQNSALSNPAGYGVTKAGLIQFTRWLSTTLAPKIRANSISPGGIYRRQPAEFVKRYIERTPVGRMGDENDFRGAIAYLSSDLSKYVTGTNLIVDGGWSAS